MPFEIPFIRPVFPNSALIAQDIDEIVASNWYTNFGPREREFSAAIGSRIGDGFRAVTFANATVGLMAVLQAVFERGDGTRSILLPSFTFAAGAEAIEWTGYRPLLIDIEPLSLQPSLSDARTALDDSANDIAGILLCNTFGIGNAEIREWELLAQEYGVPIVVDSAAGFGSRYSDGTPVGTAAMAEVFSFHATKPFAIGEGGAVVTRDDSLADAMESFQNFGFRNGLGAAALGLNGKLQEINAVIGLRQLETFDAAISSRQAVLEAYREGLQGEDIHFADQSETSSVCFASLIFPDLMSRERARIELLESGAEVRTYYSPAVHRQPHFSDARRASTLSSTERVADTILSLPVHQNMQEVAINTIIDAIKRAGTRS